MSLFSYLPWELLLAAALVGCLVGAAWATPVLRRSGPGCAVTAAARVLLVPAALGVLAVTSAAAIGGGGGVNLQPGAGIASALRNPNTALGMVNLFGNVAMFVPLGLLLPLATRWRWPIAAAVCVAASVGIEIVQLLSGRSADIDDVLLNSLGAVLGAALGGLLSRRTAGVRRSAAPGAATPPTPPAHRARHR